MSVSRDQTMAVEFSSDVRAQYSRVIWSIWLSDDPAHLIYSRVTDGYVPVC